MAFCVRPIVLKVFGFVLLLVGGCSVRPAPENSAGFKAEYIVSKIRCELRDGIRSFVVGALQDPRRTKSFPHYQQIAAELMKGDDAWIRLSKSPKSFSLDPQTLAVFERYNHAAVAYHFTFDMTETNTNNGGLEFLRTISGGTLSVGITANSSLSRTGIQEFRIADNFANLVSLVESEYCSPNGYYGKIHAQAAKTNIIYPIVGKLYLDELIGTFLDLNQSGNLVGSTDNPDGEKEWPTSINIVEFTTKFVGVTCSPFSRQL